jgi:hypothetical protein
MTKRGKPGRPKGSKNISPPKTAPTEKFLTVGEYALHRNVTTVRIYTLLRQGRIPKETRNGQTVIPVERADACIEASQGVAQKINEALGEGDQSPETYAGNRAKRERYEMELKRLKYEKEAGLLIEKGTIEKIAFEVARRTRDNILSVPDRVAADIAAETDPQKVHFMLTEALHAALEHGLADPMKGTETPLVTPSEPLEEESEDESGDDDTL